MDIKLGKQDGIMILHFNRADKKNAITAAMYQTMADALAAAENDESVQVVLITGHAQVFTAGNDLEDFLINPPLRADSPVFRFMHQMVHATKPVVAAVSGAAVGIGTTLLLHCDLVYAADTARFSLPFVQLGLCPEFASSLLLQHTAGFQRAAEKLMLGESFSAIEACEMGLVNQVVSVEALPEFARAQASRLAALPVDSVRITKRLMTADRRPTIEARIAEENAAFSRLLQAPEAKKAIVGFLEKRKPTLQGNGTR
ncbi:MAG: enoyl-CoA hydratase [Pseudomonadota bacterium]